MSLVLEKQEVANLAISILQLLEELEEKFPELTPAASSNSDLIPESPVEPLFRVGQLIVGYDEEDDMIWLIAKALIISESGTALDPEDEKCRRCVSSLRANRCARSASTPWKPSPAAGPPAPCADSPSTATAISVRAPMGKPCPLSFRPVCRRFQPGCEKAIRPCHLVDPHLAQPMPRSSP